MSISGVLETGLSTITMFVSIWFVISSCILIKLLFDRLQYKASGFVPVPYRRRDFFRSSIIWSVILPFPVFVGGVVYFCELLKTRMIKM